MNIKRLLTLILFCSYSFGTVSWSMDWDRDWRPVEQEPMSPVENPAPENQSFLSSTPVLIGGGVLLLGALILGIKLLLDKKKTAQFNDLALADTTLNGVPLKIQSRYSNAGVDIIQLPVDRQRGASCGYHSLKNGILIAQGLLKKDKTLCQELLNAAHTERLFGQKTLGWSWLNLILGRLGKKQSWRSYVQEAFKGKDHYDYMVNDISSAALESLVIFEQNNQLLMNKRCPYDVIVLDDISVIGSTQGPEKDNGFENNKHTPDYITPFVQEKMRAAQRLDNTYACVFLVNDGRQYSDRAGNWHVSLSNHWYTVVLFVQGSKHTYVVTDSLGNVSRITSTGRADSRLRRLVNTLENKQVV